MTERNSSTTSDGPTSLPERAEGDRNTEKRRENAHQPGAEEASGKWIPERVYRFVGLGTELAGFTLVFAGLGHLVDRASEMPKPYGTALGALIGFSLGMVRFIWQVNQSDES